ncbi:Antitoxin HicB 1 [Candidatus Magnetomoraceae bacterium gMMP-15]
MWDYPVELTPDEEDGGFVVTFPDVPEAITQGEDRDEALLYARDALETALSMYVDDRRDLPVPSPADGRDTVRPNALECAKLDIYTAIRVQGVHKAELARRLHWYVPQVNRLLDLGHASTKLSQVEQAAASLGKRVELRVV